MSAPCRTAVATGLSSVALLVGCAVERGMPPPECSTGETVLLVAQSVPSAELVPCFESLPPGWEIDIVTIDQDGTEIRFDSDRAGDEAATFHYTSTCDLGAAVVAPSEHDGTERRDLIERVVPAFRAQRFYVFSGGCMWWEFDFAEGATAALSVELGDRLAISTRDALNDSIRENFLDEEV